MNLDTLSTTFKNHKVFITVCLAIILFYLFFGKLLLALSWIGMVLLGLLFLYFFDSYLCDKIVKFVLCIYDYVRAFVRKF